MHERSVWVTGEDREAIASNVAKFYRTQVGQVAQRKSLKRFEATLSEEEYGQLTGARCRLAMKGGEFDGAGHDILACYDCVFSMLDKHDILCGELTIII